MYPDATYLMSKPFEDGMEIILCGLKRRNREITEKILHDIYWFAQQNSLNEKESEQEFVSGFLLPVESERKKETSDEILQHVKTIMEGF